MKKKGLFIVLLLIFCLVSGNIFCRENIKKKEGRKPLAPTEKLNVIAKVVAYTTEHAHFKKQKINTEISQGLFDEYFKTLDPGRNFFTQADMKRFSPHRDKIAFRLAAGDLTFAFEVFLCFRERLEAYEKFVNKFLTEKVPLYGKET